MLGSTATAGFAASPNARDGEIRISCVGDSITYGELCTGGNQATQSYPAQMQQLLGDGFTVSNFGVNGATMMKDASLPYVNQQAYRDSLASQPDIVIIMLGTNDANGSNPAKLGNFEADARELIQTYQNLDTHPTVYVATSATCYFTDAQPGIITDQVVPMQKKVAEELGCTVIDIHEATKGLNHLFPDNLHPNREGYGIIAGVMCAAVVRGESPDQAVFDLAKAYAAAQTIDRAGQVRYTEDTWAVFQQAFASASEMLLNHLDTLTGQQITEITASLNQGMDQLEEIEVPDGPVLHYDFNQVENGVVKDLVNGFDGQLMGNVTASEGFKDGAVTLGGTRNDYISVPGEVFGMTDDITISTWVNLDRNPTWASLLVSGDDTADCFSFATSGGGFGVNYGINVGNVNYRVGTSPSDAVPVGEWAHIVYTQEGTTGRMYLNGRLVGTNTGMVSLPRDLVYGAKTQLGASHLYNDPGLLGDIEDFCIYSGALTAEEVTALYESWTAEEASVASVASCDPVTVEQGTAFADLSLPETMMVSLNNGETAECSVVWSEEGYDAQTAGDYQLTGEIVLPEGVTNPLELTASIQVTVRAAAAQPADKTALVEAIQQAEQLAEDAYTADSWEAFVAALAAAQAVMEDENASQDQVDAAVAALAEAREGLSERTEDPDPSQPEEPSDPSDNGQTGSDNEEDKPPVNTPGGNDNDTDADASAPSTDQGTNGSDTVPQTGGMTGSLAAAGALLAASAAVLAVLLRKKHNR